MLRSWGSGPGAKELAWKGERKRFVGILVGALLFGLLAGAGAAYLSRFHTPWVKERGSARRAR